MPISLKHFTTLFLILMVLSTGTIIAIFKVESDTSTNSFISDEQKHLAYQLELTPRIDKNSFLKISSFHKDATSILSDSTGATRFSTASDNNLTKAILSEISEMKPHEQFHVHRSASHLLIVQKIISDNSYFTLVYDSKILKKRNGKRFIFYYLLLVTTSLIMSMVFARLKDKQQMIRQREQDFLIKLHEKNLELEEKNAAYLAAINSKNRFFSIVAHDLRNPFQVVLGYTGLLLENYENMTDEEVKEYFADIETATGQLMRLLDNLLLWSRSQTGSITMRPTRLDLQSLTSSTIALVGVNASNKKVELISKIPPHCFIEADRDMVLTILRNLMTNAVKYTPSDGKITVFARPLQDDFLQITIKDTGIGMSQENMEKLFRTDTTYSHKGTNGEEGTGLGLVLCAEFVEKHGGRIWVESELGEGSEFHFTLPHHADSAIPKKDE